MRVSVISLLPNCHYLNPSTRLMWFRSTISAAVKPNDDRVLTAAPGPVSTKLVSGLQFVIHLIHVHLLGSAVIYSTRLLTVKVIHLLQSVSKTVRLLRKIKCRAADLSYVRNHLGSKY